MSGGKVKRILDNETDQDAVVDVYNLLFRAFEENPDGLSLPERTIYYVEELDNGLNMGSLKQFFLDPSGGHAHEIMSALRDINSVRVLQILESAVAQYPDGHVPKDANARRAITQQIEGKASPVWESLDNEFGEYEEDIYALQTEYMRKNIAAFR